MTDAARALPALVLRRPTLRGSGQVLRHALLISAALVVAYPFIRMVSASLMDQFDATAVPPVLLPSSLHPENYVIAWQAEPWVRFFANTVLVATVATAAEVLTAVLAAYAFARMEFPGKSALFVVLLATYMVPPEATLIPSYVMMSKRGLDWFDTYQVQIVPFAASVFSIFLLRQHFLSIPRELVDAARIDGAGHLRFLWHVVLPLSVPALVTIAILSFLGSWNALLWPLIMTSVPDYRPIQVAVAAFQESARAQYQLQMAAATFTIAPIVAFYLIAQRHLIEGVARTGIRG